MNNKIPNVCSVKTHFEDAYLKTKDLQKTLSKMSNEEIEAKIKDPEFQRVITHLAQNAFNKNERRFLNCGFGYEDVRSIITVYAIEYFPTVDKSVTGKDFYYLMMRFINQRLINFSLRFDVKFKVSEREDELYLTEKISNDWDFDTIEMQYTLTNPLEVEPSYRETEIDLRRQLKNMKEEILTVKSDDELQAQTRKLELTMLIKRGVNSQVAHSRKMFKELKEELESNIPKYSKDLAYLANCEYTSHAVRKRARVLCKRYGIDYKSTT